MHSIVPIPTPPDAKRPATMLGCSLWYLLGFLILCLLVRGGWELWRVLHR
jgi:hypothetical protein